MPTTLPVMSTSAPPLLPGLIAASVWMAGYVGGVALAVGADVDRPVQRAHDAAGHGRLEAERRADRHHALADVEVAGLADASPGVRPETSSAWITAVSVSGSVPRTSASAWCRR